VIITLDRKEILAIGPELKTCLSRLGINASVLLDVVQGLFKASSHDPANHKKHKLNRIGNPMSYTQVARDIGNFTIQAEDRGPTYTIWITENSGDDPNGGVILIRELPWGVLPELKQEKEEIT